MIAVGVGDGLAVGVRVTVTVGTVVGVLASGSGVEGVGVRVTVGDPKHRRQNGSPGTAPGPANSVGG